MIDKINTEQSANKNPKKRTKITVSDVALVLSIITFIIVTVPKIIMFFS